MFSIKPARLRGATRKELKNRFRVILQFPHEFKRVLITQVLPLHVPNQVVSVTRLVNRRFAIDDLGSERLEIIAGPDVVHASYMRDDQIVSQQLSSHKGILRI